MNWIVKTLHAASDKGFLVHVYVGQRGYTGFVKAIDDETVMLWDTGGYGAEYKERWYDRVILICAITEVLPVPETTLENC